MEDPSFAHLVPSVPGQNHFSLSRRCLFMSFRLWILMTWGHLGFGRGRKNVFRIVTYSYIHLKHAFKSKPRYLITTFTQVFIGKIQTDFYKICFKNLTSSFIIWELLNWFLLLYLLI